MTISFTDRAILPKDVLIKGIGGESVLLNLNNQRYFGLDEVGARRGCEKARTAEHPYKAPLH
jgi:hypothetical protein